MIGNRQRSAGVPPPESAEAMATETGRIVSVLFADPDAVPPDDGDGAPDYFQDLSLDQVVTAITKGFEEYDLAPFFHVRLMSLAAVAYRQDVMRDMEDRTLRRAIGAFAERMRTMRQRLGLTKKGYYEREKQRWFLGAVEAYADAVEGLAGDLEKLELTSLGLRSFREALAVQARAETFRTLVEESRRVAASLATIRYGLLIDGGTVTVSLHGGESDYSVAVVETFRKFQQGSAKDYRYKFQDVWTMNHIEAQIVDRVALLHPETFAALERFCQEHAEFVDPMVARFDREIQFFVATLDHVERLRRVGLSFCTPQLLDRRKDIAARDTFDMALAEKLRRENGTVVCNGFFLQGVERMLVVTGPNQGGKTTFARTFGQLHHLASLGLPVPGREARLLLADGIFTHFERGENLANLHGKLEDDLVRIRRILDRATSKSILIINEIFSSTTLDDALLLGREVLGRILELDALCVCTTFLDELTALGEKTVSVVAAVDPDDPAVRTFRIERRPADGLAYALAIAEKRRVTYRWLVERIRT